MRSPPPVRFADLAARHALDGPRTERDVLAVLRSGRWIGGSVVDEAERTAARLFHRPRAVGVASGTDALMLALQALGIGAGHRVALPALTFFATAGAVCNIGAIPVLVDVDERGLLDPAALDRIPLPDALIPVHLFGNACRARLPVPTVDDAAQAAGCSTPAGTLTAVSTYPTKAWGGAGDGGFVLGGDAVLLEAVRLLGNHGARATHHHGDVGGHVGRNSRLDPLHAAVLLGQARSFEARRARRRTIATYYDAHLPETVRPLPRDPDNATAIYCVRCTDRDALRRRFADAGIETAIYYPHPLHAQPALRGRAEIHPTPTADRLADQLLALPIHAGLTDDDVERVVRAARLP